MLCVAQVQRCFACCIGHRQVIHGKASTIHWCHRTAGDLPLRGGHLLGRTAPVGLGDVAGVLRCLQSEIRFVQRHLLPAAHVQLFQPGRLHQRIGLAHAQRSFAAAFPGEAQADGAVDALVLPAAAADAVLRADLAGAQRQFQCRPQCSSQRITLRTAQFQRRRAQVRVVRIHGMLRVLQADRPRRRCTRQCGQQGRRTREEIHARHGKVAHLRQTFPNLARSLQCESC